MPYEYRRLTPAEREEVLRYRREQGHPLHSPPHLYRDEGWYLLSAANYEHAPMMAAPERRTEFEGRLLAAMASIRVEVAAWVVLPNHYHVLAGGVSFPSLSAALKRLHGAISYEWNAADGKRGRRVWYKYSDRAIRSDRHYFAALNYLHYNPVKHGYVEDAYEWPWQSLGSYLEALGRDWLRSTWREYPPGDMGKGWDD
ncbi:MAG: REP-associated tyrosine transposase [Anaerolineae bacterium]